MAMKPSVGTRTKPTLVGALVTRSNDLVNARQDAAFTLNETRLVYACVATVDPRKPLDPCHIFTIDADRFSQLFPVSKKKAYEELPEAGERLFNQKVSIRHQDGSYRLTRLVSSVEYKSGAGYLEVRLTPEFGALISNLRSRFTTVSLFSVSRMSSASTIRIYELLSEYSFIGRRIVSVDDLRAFLGLQTVYPKFSVLERNVIKPAMETINSQTELRIQYKTSKRGRIVTHLEFSINVNEEFEPKLPTPTRPSPSSADRPTSSAWPQTLAHLESTLPKDAMQWIRTAYVSQRDATFELQYANKMVIEFVRPHLTAISEALQRFTVERPTVKLSLGGALA